MRLNTLYGSLLLPVIGVLIAATFLTSALAYTALARSLAESTEVNAVRVAELAAGTARPYVANYDLTALGNLVNQIVKDERMTYAEIFTADGMSFTEDQMQRPASMDGMAMIDMPIVDASGNETGMLKLAYSTTYGRDKLLQQTALIAGLLLIVSVVVGLALSWTARRVVRQVGGEPEFVASVAHRVAEGDLSIELDLRDDDKTSVMRAMQVMVARLRENTAEIRLAADSIRAASAEISEGNSVLSRRTETQAQSLDEATSSMELMTSTVRKNADNATQASELADEARKKAEAGGSVVTGAVSAMGEINAASRKIEDITGVVDEIAFQTNLLALNAAVEAARAGEQGRGFAVVATEVRNLAQRSANAAKEIKDLIHDSVQKVDTGSKLVDESGETLVEIVDAIRQVSSIVSEIAAASKAQSEGIEQVNQSIMQMDDVTHQNAALVEQVEAGAKSLEDQAVMLTERVAYFRLGRDEASTLRGTSTPARLSKPAPPKNKPAQPAARLAMSPPSKKSASTTPADDAAWQEF